MFLVIMPREVDPRTNQFPVTCLEIQKVLPALNSVSFVPMSMTTNRPYIKSEIQTNLRTRQTWFEIPGHAMPEDWKTIVKEVYVSKFSEEVYDEYAQQQPASNEAAPAAAAKYSTNNPDNFVSKLDNLNLDG